MGGVRWGPSTITHVRMRRHSGVWNTAWGDSSDGRRLCAHRPFLNNVTGTLTRNHFPSTLRNTPVLNTLKPRLWRYHHTLHWYTPLKLSFGERSPVDPPTSSLKDLISGYLTTVDHLLRMPLESSITNWHLVQTHIGHILSTGLLVDRLWLDTCSIGFALAVRGVLEL